VSLRTFDKINQTFNHFKDITAPLKDIFKLSFGYMITFNDSQYYTIIEDLECLTKFVTHVKKSTIFCDRNVTNHFDGEYNFTLWPQVPKSLAMEVYNQYNIWNGITISRINDYYTELYWFTGSITETNLNKFFIRNKLLLLEFIHYFDTLKETLFIPTSNTQQDLFKFSKGFNTNIAKPSEYLKNESPLIKKFFNTISSVFQQNELLYKNINLSLREIEILSIIGKGYTAKNAAKKLNISIKTAQHHIEHIKQKTNLHYRAELVQLYQDYFCVDNVRKKQIGLVSRTMAFG
jgi:DNA-binding CsgD family transcriptional regulator